MPYGAAPGAADQDELVREHLPLVKKIALHLAARLPAAIELNDLLQVGVIGLIQAGAAYDPARGASFATYAGIRIKGAMLDEVRRGDWAPRSVQQNLRRVSQAISLAEGRLGRSASDRDIAEQMGLSLDQYHELSTELVHSRLVSLEEAAPAESAAVADPMDSLAEAQLRRQLAAAIGTLPEREAMVMSLYHGDELNLKEIGAVLGVTESRVSQLHGQALARIRAAVAGQDGEDPRA